MGVLNKKPFILTILQAMLLLATLLLSVAIIMGLLSIPAASNTGTSIEKIILHIITNIVIVTLILSAFFAIKQRRAHGKAISIASVIIMWAVTVYSFHSSANYSSLSAEELHGAALFQTITNIFYLVILILLVASKKVRNYFSCKKEPE